jgi:dipeptidyl aminopeptidase/acylaminoacyl peptidase
MLRVVAFAEESQPVISPTGEWAAYATTDGSDQANILARHPTAFLFVVSTAGGAPKRILDAEHADTPVWCPDGSKLAFLGERGSSSQPMIWDAASGAARAIGNDFARDRSVWSSEGLTLHWTPDGRTLLVSELQDEPAPAQEPRRTVIRGSDTVVPGDVFFIDKRMWKLVAIDVESGRRRELDANAFALRGLALSPDSRWALVRAVVPETRGHFRAEKTETLLLALDGATAPRQVEAAAFSPDGRELLDLEKGELHARAIDGSGDRVIAAGIPRGARQPIVSKNWMAMLAPRPGTGPADPNMYSILRPTDDVLVIDLRTGRTRKLTPPDRADEIGDVVWSADGGALFYRTVDPVTYRETAHRWIAGEKQSSELYSADEALGKFSVSADGGRLAFTSMSARRAADAYVLEVSSRERRAVTNLNPQLSPFEFAAPQMFDFRSADGDLLQALLFRPSGASPVPVVTYVYEKLSSQKNRFNPEAQMHVTHGYAYLEPDVLVKAGHTGESFVKSAIPAINATRAMGFTNGKFGINGGSFGGYAGLYLISHSDIFAAAVLRAPPSDFFSTWADGRDRDIWTIDNGQARANGDPWKARESYLENSPFFSADRVHTPLLIMHGQKDYTVPTQQGEMMFYALRYLKRPVELVLYRDGDHSIVRGSRDDYLDYYQRTLDWWQKYLQ